MISRAALVVRSGFVSMVAVAACTTALTSDEARALSHYAIYGLARHAGDAAVRARLLEVDASARRDVRNNMAAVLALVNDSSARSVLAVISRRDLRPDTIQMIEIALRPPAKRAGKGRHPCLPDVPGPWKGQCPQ